MSPVSTSSQVGMEAREAGRNAPKKTRPSTSGGSGKPRLLDLFSGISGFSLGLERAGFETAAFCEISAKPRHLLATHWPGVPCFDDVTTLTATDLPGGVDAICGGFPCQDVSLAGKGAGLAGERSGLWREYARLVREFRPRYVIVENVSALLGRGLGDVLGDLAALGYDAWWDCIPASAVGAPHRRDRVWIVAYPGGLEHQGFGDALRREIAAELPRAYLANAPCELRDRRGAGAEQGRRGEPANSGSVGDTDSPGLSFTGNAGGPSEAPGGVEAWRTSDRAGRWSAEPNVGRVAHGVPARVDRLHGLGNAVVPQIPEILGRAILAAEAACRLERAA